MIRKRGLQDVKRRNRQVIIQSILENDGLSRVEIAQKTELSPSTVSTLVSELIGEGVLAESGSHTTTAGRSPVMQPFIILLFYQMIDFFQFDTKFLFIQFLHQLSIIKVSLP